MSKRSKREFDDDVRPKKVKRHHDEEIIDDDDSDSDHEPVKFKNNMKKIKKGRKTLNDFEEASQMLELKTTIEPKEDPIIEEHRKFHTKFLDSWKGQIKPISFTSKPQQPFNFDTLKELALTGKHLKNWHLSRKFISAVLGNMLKFLSAEESREMNSFGGLLMGVYKSFFNKNLLAKLKEFENLTPTSGVFCYADANIKTLADDEDDDEGLKESEEVKTDSTDIAFENLFAEVQEALTVIFKILSSVDPIENVVVSSVQNRQVLGKDVKFPGTCLSFKKPIITFLESTKSGDNNTFRLDGNNSQSLIDVICQQTQQVDIAYGVNVGTRKKMNALDVNDMCFKILDDLHGKQDALIFAIIDNLSLYFKRDKDNEVRLLSKSYPTGIFFIEKSSPVLQCVSEANSKK